MDLNRIRQVAPMFTHQMHCTCILWRLGRHESAITVRETVYRRRPGLPGRRTDHLEQPAGQRDICPVSVDLPSAFKNISVPGLVP